uniref:SAP domain-containing protein n=1 Tax=Parascaris equorum TaxID=6256 RepID=A0A914RAA7_PAREQ
MASMNKADLEAIELTLQQFRVNELHILLSTFRCPKLGKKNELIQRLRHYSSCLNYLPAHPVFEPLRGRRSISPYHQMSCAILHTEMNRSFCLALKCK